jgi:chromate transporter
MMNPEQVFIAVFLASLLGFGGLGSLPVLRGQLSSAGVAPDQLILPAVAVGNISPGPNGLYLVVVGYLVDGLLGATVAVIAVVLPPMLVLLLDRLRARLIHLRRFRSALASLGLGVVALLAVTAGQLVVHADATWLGAIFTVVGLAALLLRVPPVVAVAAAIAVGFIVR